MISDAMLSMRPLAYVDAHGFQSECFLEDVILIRKR
jgi:hypothetical protein